MDMKTQKMKKTIMKQPNINKAIYIKGELLRRGKTQTMIAEDLGITDAAVSRALRDLSPNRRVNRWCEEHLGVAL